MFGLEDEMQDKINYLRAELKHLETKMNYELGRAENKICALKLKNTMYKDKIHKLEKKNKILNELLYWSKKEQENGTN